MREHLGKYIRLPPEVIRAAIISHQKATIEAAEIGYWITIMREQEMLRGNPTPASVLWS